MGIDAEFNLNKRYTFDGLICAKYCPFDVEDIEYDFVTNIRLSNCSLNGILKI